VPHDELSVPLLGNAQWTWIEKQLRKPAEIRLDCSSTQFISAQITLKVSAAIKNGTILAVWSVPATRLPGEEIWERSCGNRFG